MAKILIVANWKMNPSTLAEAKKLFDSVKKTKAIICPPFVFLSTLKANGAQDCFWQDRGAYTGEVSPQQLKSLGCQYVILGHSERRRYQNETDQIISKKVKAALMHGLKPILCISKISQLKDIPKNVIIAFEPLSAIGTGNAFDPQKAKKVRTLLKNFKIVLYGGSVDSKNIKAYIKAGFNGALVGGASLNAKEFIKLAKNNG